MSGWDLDQSQTKALNIWLSARPLYEVDIVQPSSSSTVATAADALIAYLTSPPGAHADEFDDFSDRFANLEHALIEFCLLHPRSMDWGITVLFRVIRNVPNDAICELGEGPEGARLDLERFLANYTDLYSDGTMPRVGTRPQGGSGVRDKYAVQFSSEEVKDRPDDVIKKMENLRKSRWKTLMTQCFSARCHVLQDPIHLYNSALDMRLLTFIDLELDLTNSAWNSVDCIGILTMLRGSASYMISTLPEDEQKKKRQAWKHRLNILIFTIGEGREVDDKADEFRIRSHAAVSLPLLASIPFVYLREQWITIVSFL
jgi:hypothetical protein